MPAFLVQRNLIIDCPSEFIEYINNDGSIGQDLVQIIDTGSGTLDFWFEDSISPAEETIFDTLVSSFVCTGVDQTFGDSGASSVFNGTGSSLPVGTPVVPIGVDAQGRILIEPADAGNPSKMPAVAVVTGGPIPSLSEGDVAITGEVRGLDTSGYLVGEELFVAVGGGVTNVKPTGTALIQKISQVLETDALAGRIIVIGAGRSNDLPNLSHKSIWLGDSDGTPQEVSLTLDTFVAGAGPVEGDTIVYTGTEWVTQGSVNIEGRLSHQLVFSEAGSAKNEWLELYGDAKYSNQTMGIMPFKSKLVGITFSNKSSKRDTELRIYSTPLGGGISPKTLDYTWTIIDQRVAYKTDFPVDVVFDAGDKIGVYAADIGSDPSNVSVILYFVSIDNTTGEGSEDFSSNYATNTGGGSS